MYCEAIVYELMQCTSNTRIWLYETIGNISQGIIQQDKGIMFTTHFLVKKICLHYTILMTALLE